MKLLLSLYYSHISIFNLRFIFYYYYYYLFSLLVKKLYIFSTFFFLETGLSVAWAFIPQEKQLNECQKLQEKQCPQA